MTTFFDSHAHLTHEKISDEEVQALLLRAKEASVTEIINICTDKASLKRGVALAALDSSIYTAAATTPHDVEKEGEALFPLIESYAKEGRLAAVGETGLDYYYDHSDRKVQQHFLKRYMQLAINCNLPLIIHCREAFEDLFAIADAHYKKAPPLVLHCFTGTLEEAKEVLSRNWYLSLSGIVTFKRSDELKEVAKIVPKEQLLIETDTPYLAPQSKRGKQNEPAYLPETAILIAALKGMTLDALALATRENGERLLKALHPLSQESQKQCP